MALRDEYENLFQYARTESFRNAGLKARQCATSAIYAHYCNKSALEPHIQSIIKAAQECERYLGFPYNLKNGIETWVCLYVGEVAISPKGRTAADRFRHQFELCGYFQQAPALEALCAIIYKSSGWTPVCKGADALKFRTYLQQADKAAFLDWCGQHVRCAWQPIDVHADIAKEKVRSDEGELIRELKPLLNVKGFLNPFAPYVSEARHRFRDDSKRREM